MMKITVCNEKPSVLAWLTKANSVALVRTYLQQPWTLQNAATECKTCRSGDVISRKGWMLLCLAFPAVILISVALRHAQINNGHWAKIMIAYSREVSHWKSSESISWVAPRAAAPHPMLLLQQKTPWTLLTLEYMRLKLPRTSGKGWIQVLAGKAKDEWIPSGLLYFLNWHVYSDSQTVSDCFLRSNFLLLLEKDLPNLMWSVARLESPIKQLLHFNQIMLEEEGCTWMYLNAFFLLLSRALSVLQYPRLRYMHSGSFLLILYPQ